ncbi:conserved hypothetical protein [Neospora caninum Liverpool]|uniref:Uncharacterized protein n=1 Tax=Neospora caninum (strain Liverpool) TaxID=572307 RepID=F0VFG7_NEOCL|nr:conserved hypothetical protein [Neospora caninum Liverpool]CBZ52461.1 conserved hypothetical protein [Neospora caninum Liverpool]CEL66436.1 TPA: hypothetical protein BN1204_022500 [Neospora caninum Liverpool]|eukprot:XP_003882493.1 conserved hypothetical protein [Neospora caninum Liverpool]
MDAWRCSTLARRPRGASSCSAPKQNCPETGTALSPCLDWSVSTAGSSVAKGAASAEFHSRSCSFESTSLFEMETGPRVDGEATGGSERKDRRNARGEARSSLEGERSGMREKTARCEEGGSTLPEGSKRRWDKKKGEVSKAVDWGRGKPRAGGKERKTHEKSSRSPQLQPRERRRDTEEEEKRETGHVSHRSKSPSRASHGGIKNAPEDTGEERRQEMRPHRRNSEQYSREASRDRASPRHVESRRRENASVQCRSQPGEGGEEGEEEERDTNDGAAVGKRGASSRRSAKHRKDEDDGKDGEEEESDSDWEVTLPTRHQPPRVFRASNYRALVEEAKKKGHTKARTAQQPGLLSLYGAEMWESSEEDDDWSPEKVYGRAQARRLLKSRQSESSSDDEDSSEASEDVETRGPQAAARVCASAIPEKNRGICEHKRDESRHRTGKDGDRAFPSGKDTRSGSRSRPDSSRGEAGRDGEDDRASESRREHTRKRANLVDGAAADETASGGARRRRKRPRTEEGRERSSTRAGEERQSSSKQEASGAQSAGGKKRSTRQHMHSHPRSRHRDGRKKSDKRGKLM